MTAPKQARDRLYSSDPLFRLATHYHAQRPALEREQIQRAWMSGEILILTATVAFGMGIDKADVRWVFHHSMPKSLEGVHCSPIME